MLFGDWCSWLTSVVEGEAALELTWFLLFLFDRDCMFFVVTLLTADAVLYCSVIGHRS